jgi:hypothetical protein
VIPRNKALLVPIVYTIVDSVIPGFSKSEPAMDVVARARELMQSMRDLRLEIDGHRVPNLERFAAHASSAAASNSSGIKVMRMSSRPRAR